MAVKFSSEWDWLPNTSRVLAGMLYTCALLNAAHLKAEGISLRAEMHQSSNVSPLPDSMALVMELWKTLDGLYQTLLSYQKEIEPEICDLIYKNIHKLYA